VVAGPCGVFEHVGCFALSLRFLIHIIFILAQIDRLQRGDLIAKMETTLPHTSDERQLLIKSLSYAAYRLIGGRIEKSEDISGMDSNLLVKKAQHVKWKRIQGGGNINDLAIKRFTKFKIGDPIMWYKATSAIHASSKQVFAWMWLYTSNHRMKAHQKKDGNMIRQFYKPSNKKASGEQQVSDGAV